MEVKLHTFLASALDGGEWSASHISYFTLRVRPSGAPEPDWTQWQREKVPPLHLSGIEPW